MYICVHNIYLYKYKNKYVHYMYIYIYILFLVSFLTESPGQRQGKGQVIKLLCGELCHQGLDLTSVSH